MAEVESVRGVGKVLAFHLRERGLTTAEALAAAPPDDLVTVPGIGASRAMVLVMAAREAAGVASVAAVPDAAPMAETVVPVTATAEPTPAKVEKKARTEKPAKAKKAAKAEKKTKADKAAKADKKKGEKAAKAQKEDKKKAAKAEKKKKDGDKDAKAGKKARAPREE